MQDKDLSLRSAIFWIALSALLISGSAGAGFFLYKKWLKERVLDARYNISGIIQTGPESEALSTDYLASILGLQGGAPVNLFVFDVNRAKERLLMSPLIRKAEILKIKPDKIYIDYIVRRPCALLADYENTLLDEEGNLFPASPFLSPLNLPKIYLGLPEFNQSEDSEKRPGGSFKEPLQCKHLRLALHLLELLSAPPLCDAFHLQLVDVSTAFSPSYGRREIVLEIEEEMELDAPDHKVRLVFPRFLRLHAKNYAAQLGNYLTLREKIIKDYRGQLANMKNLPAKIQFKPRTIDFRIPQLAFIDEEGK